MSSFCFESRTLSLQRAFASYRVPISKVELSMILRIIDPDQSGDLSLEEWIAFMT